MKAGSKENKTRRTKKRGSPSPWTTYLLLANLLIGDDCWARCSPIREVPWALGEHAKPTIPPPCNPTSWMLNWMTCPCERETALARQACAIYRPVPTGGQCTVQHVMQLGNMDMDQITVGNGALVQLSGCVYLCPHPANSCLVLR